MKNSNQDQRIIIEEKKLVEQKAEPIKNENQKKKGSFMKLIKAILKIFGL